MLQLDNTALVVIDVQGNLAQMMYKRDALFTNLEILIKAAKELRIPILWNEQLPDKIGPTIPQLQVLLSNQAPLIKRSFSCCGEPQFMETLKKLTVTHLLICGIEAHVCVYQTVRDLLAHGYRTHAISDAVSSRTGANKKIALQRMRELGAVISSVEMALFELLRVAEGNEFKSIIKLVK
ncbi:hydrolase [candidate division KSB1 bacterium]|nr:hydrolase [candidate division KSB1 bacterium]